MTEKQVIEKAAKAMKALEIGYDKNIEPVAIYVSNQQLLEIDESLKDHYSICFEDRLPWGGLNSNFVQVDKSTHKLIRILTKHGSIEIPEELR